MLIDTVRRLFLKNKDEKNQKQCINSEYGFDDSPYVYCEGKCTVNSLSNQYMIATCYVNTIITFPEFVLYDFESVNTSKQFLNKEQIIFKEFLELWGDEKIRDLGRDGLADYFIQAHKNGELYEYFVKKMRNELGTSRIFYTESQIVYGYPEITHKAINLQKVRKEESDWFFALMQDLRSGDFVGERDDFFHRT